jgi:hypothetical protein
LYYIRVRYYTISPVVDYIIGPGVGAGWGRSSPDLRPTDPDPGPANPQSDSDPVSFWCICISTLLTSPASPSLLLVRLRLSNIGGAAKIALLPRYRADTGTRPGLGPVSINLLPKSVHFARPNSWGCSPEALQAPEPDGNSRDGRIPISFLGKRSDSGFEDWKLRFGQSLELLLVSCLLLFTRLSLHPGCWVFVGVRAPWGPSLKTRDSQL